MDRVYRVGGMTCGGCVGSVTAALLRVGVDAAVDLGRAEARVRGPHDPATVRRAIEGAGFEFGGAVEASSDR